MLRPLFLAFISGQKLCLLPVCSKNRGDPWPTRTHQDNADDYHQRRAGGAPLARGSPTMFAYVLTPVGLLLICGLRYRRKADLHSLRMAVLLISIMGLASCSDSNSPPAAGGPGGGDPSSTGTPAGTSNVTVTASSGLGNGTVPIQLTVTR